MSADWAAVAAGLDEHGSAVIDGLLDPDACRRLAASYDEPGLFRSRIVMARHGFGRGEYQYFGYPLPGPVAGLRTALYPPLAAIANRWHGAARFPPAQEEFLARCHAAGQAKPTPLLLRYGPGDFNCLHQDLYGSVAFPLQLLVFLSQPAVEYQGGEFLLVEQRMQAQSIGRVVQGNQGDAILWGAALGAAIADLGAFQGHGSVAEEMAALARPPRPTGPLHVPGRGGKMPPPSLMSDLS